MEYIFWQNVISIHQVPFLENLALFRRVTLVVEKEIDNFRAKQGWNIPKLENVAIIVNPSDEQVIEILKSNLENFHFFSGFSLNKMLKNSLNQAVKNRIPNIGIILEPYNRNGYKGFLRDLKYLGYVIKFKNRIKALLVTGELGRKCYSRIGFPDEIIFDWGYFTKSKSFNKDDFVEREKKRLLFVGSIIERKNLLGVIDLIIKNSDEFDEFNIVGSGDQELELSNIIKKVNNIKLLGNVSNDKVREIMIYSDILILPSLFDGWGAVVNEALQHGSQVIASESCGSGVLLDGNIRGEVFNHDGKDFERVLKKWLATKPLSAEKRYAIIKWSEDSISPEKIPVYFNSIINYVLKRNEVRPIAPWI